MLTGWRKFFSVFLILGATMLLASCVEEQPEEAEQEAPEATTTPTEETMMAEETAMEGTATPSVEGMIAVESDYDVDETISRLEQNAEDDGNMIVATVPHSQAAEDAGLELRPTTLLIFGNPEAGTGLIQASRSMGIDLPQKFLAWEDENGQTWLAYNDIEYLAERHGITNTITGMDAQVAMISENLRSLAENTAGGEVMEDTTAMESTAMESTAMDSMASPEGLVTVESEVGFDETVANVEGAAEEQGSTVVAAVDHSENAASIDREIPPNSLVIFGNPEAGTPLMQSSQTAGLDLPQKMLVWEDETGAVNVSYNDPEYLADRHGLEDEQIEAVSAGLEMLARSATGAMMSEATTEETTSP